VPAHRAGIKRLALHGDRLVSSSYDRTLRLWRVDGERLEPLCATELPAVVWARAVAVDAAGRVLLGTFGTTYAVFDPGSGAWDLEGIGDTPGLNAVHASGGRVFTVGDAGVVERDGVAVARLGSSCNFVTRWGGRVVAGGQLGALFDAERGVVLHQHPSPLNCAVVLGDGDLVVGTYTGEGLRLRERDGGVSLVEVLRLHEQAVKGVAARGDALFSVSAAGDAALYGAWRLPHAHDRIANGVCALADGRFATVSRDRKLRLWTGDRAEVVDSPHAHSIKCVAATADGRRVATGSYDGTVALYDLERGAWGPVERPTCAGISSLCADAAPHAVLASGYDGRVYRIEGAP
jgi:WD40 repeat protein